MLTKKATPKTKVSADAVSLIKNIETHSVENNNKTAMQTPASTPGAQANKNLNPKIASTTESTSASDKKANPTTRVIIRYDAGFGNQLHIRGNSANLSWQKGQPLKNIKADEWLWETNEPFNLCEFKVLLNDAIFEIGDNHLVRSGVTLFYIPHFPE